MSQAEQVEAAVRAFLDDAGLEWELGGRPGELVVTLPGDKKLRTVCSLVVTEQSLSVSAFVVRNPDENHEAVYRYLLRRNLRLPGLAYAIDKTGDVYVTGRVPLAGADAAYLDQILGVVLDAADGAFNELLALGFLESMKKEWAWRVSRGESTRNLQAFAHLLEPSGGQPDGEQPGERREPDGRGPTTRRPGDRSRQPGAPAAAAALRPRLPAMTYTLVLLRHGESVWNAENLFTGWVDVDLSDRGRAEAVRAGTLLKESGVLPELLHTSLLRRAITTANLALDEADRHWIPVRRDWRLNERHYGALQGKDKKATMEQYGEEQFMLWRRSFDTPPPPIGADDEFSQSGDPRYADLGDAAPATECLKDVIDRLLPYWDEAIAPDLRTGKVVCVAAHGNSLRALVKHLDGISDADIAGLNIPTGIPLVYRLNEDLEPLQRGGEYLDPEAAKDAIAAVANQGR